MSFGTLSLTWRGVWLEVPRRNGGDLRSGWDLIFDSELLLGELHTQVHLDPEEWK